ncbi:iron chelate uptake ABC transporter family permease subunit [Amycolatopsis sp. TNS106]|uniref:iron chelate uptake ABC transporter family permease subunit n=1 Tax=Amycolatopsis sp. TNS106 TaxID=2861750 RepID=UPI00351D1DA5
MRRVPGRLSRRGRGFPNRSIGWRMSTVEVRVGKATVGALLVTLLAVICAASIALGARSISLGVVWDAIFHSTGVPDHLIVRSLRVPRTLLGILAGLALGAAGALMQGHTRNPLADPGLLAVVVLGIDDLYVFIWFGFAGALVASAVVFLLGAVGGRGATPVTLALAGAAVSALLNGVISAIASATIAGWRPTGSGTSVRSRAGTPR